LLAVRNVTKTYGNFKALDNVSFTVEEGAAVLLIGPNGAGKTTAIKSILGLLNFRGSIEVDSLNIQRNGTRAREKIGYVPQALVFGYNTSVLEQGYFLAKLKGASKEDAVNALRQAGLWDIRKRKVNSLSHGMRQKLGISLALLRNPPLLIFDEPINNVDLKGQLEFRTTVQELTKQGKTLLIATHLSGLSEMVASAIVLAKGRILAQGTPQELLTKMNAADTMYLRVNPGDVQRVAQLIEATLGSKITQNSEWLVFSLPPGMKSSILEKVVLGGFKIKDLIVEPSTIESSYVKLLEGSMGA
jgi:ABC-type multidrug transport system ATPase subunit